ncbi:DUF771 domain-containing protein, partial [Mammaliicoccus lentus]
SLLYSLRSLLIKRPPTFLILTILLFKEVVQLSVDGPKVLDSKKGGVVYYPEVQGESWTFQAKQMAEFLEKNFNEIFS